MARSLADLAALSPAQWPGANVEVQPGDLSRFMPMGMGFAGPFPIRPWDDPLKTSPAGYYDFSHHGSGPFASAPMSEARGGVVYFDDEPAPADFAALLRLMGVPGGERRYAVFAAEAEDPARQRYLVQARVVPYAALSAIYRVASDAAVAAMPEQKLAAGEFLAAFMDQQREVWGRGMSPALSGTLGGDGDWAKEALCFGLMVENSYWGVCRIWSRAWLVTK